MKFEPQREDAAAYTRFVTVEDGPIHRQAHSLNGKEFRVERVVIQYTLKDGRWDIDSSYAVSLGGTVLKKDGSDSRVAHSRHPEIADWRNVHFTGEWEWVQQLVDALRPTGDPEVPLFLKELS